MRFIGILICLMVIGCTTLKEEPIVLSPSLYGERIELIFVSPEQDSILYDMDGLTVSDGGNITIWLPSGNIKEEVINHEVFHAAYAVMDWVGIPLSADTEEAYAYLIQFISKQVYGYYKFRNS